MLWLRSRLGLIWVAGVVTQAYSYSRYISWLRAIIMDEKQRAYVFMYGVIDFPLLLNQPTNNNDQTLRSTLTQHHPQGYSLGSARLAWPNPANLILRGWRLLLDPTPTPTRSCPYWLEMVLFNLIAFLFFTPRQTASHDRLFRLREIMKRSVGQSVIAIGQATARLEVFSSAAQAGLFIYLRTNGKNANQHGDQDWNNGIIIILL